MALERLRPEPMPPIRPVPEYLASGATGEIYREITDVLQVPWVGVLMLAYARYPTFFEALWRGLKPIAETRAFGDEARGVRALVEDSVEAFAPPPLTGRLEAQGYAPRELDQIRDILEVFSHGNFPYMLIGTVARLLIEGGVLGDAGAPAEPDQGRHAPDVAVQFVMVEQHHADDSLRALYEEVKAAVGLPFVNSDYKGLARWPSYFRLAWDGLKPHVGGADYEALCVRIHERLLESLARLPNPTGLNSEGLCAAAEQDASLEEIRDLCRVFQYLLPGLTINVAYFRAQLAGG